MCLHAHPLPCAILRDSVVLQMTLYSSTAIHGHCQVQYMSLSVCDDDTAGIQESDGNEKL